jgi:dipeptidyl aminopeptidase/acylaminoacyl peptidase
MRRFAFFALFSLSSVALAQAPAKRPLQVADFYKIRTVGDPQRSPDGLWVAYTVSRVDSVKDRNDSDVWWTSWDGATSIRITSSDESETSPRWSPDGKQLAFLSSRQGSKGSQIWLLNRAGGEAERISEIKGGVSSMAWAPDGKRLALVVNDPDPAADSANAKPKPIVVDKYHFKEDGQGYISPQRSHIYLFDLATRKTEQITRGDADDTGPAWSPDGTRIAFLAQREPDAEKYDNSDVYVVEARTGAEPKRLTTFQGADEGPLSWSPDGSLIAYRQGPEPKNFGYGGGFGTVAVISPNGGAPRLLATSLDRVVTGSRWTHDGRNIIGTVVDDQRQYLARIRVDGSGIERVASSVPVIGGFTEGTDGGVAALGTSPSEPGEIFAIEASGATRQLTHHNAWLGEIALASIELVVSKSDDGNEVHGILRKPAGASAGSKLPMIVRVHGGPAGQDAFQFDFEKELLAARGWAVVAPNYRGSSGRGAAYTVAIAGDWCNKEVHDIHGMVDALVKSGVADEQHLGVGGWSYGGILTDCLVASDTRFKAATSGAGVSNVFSMYGHDQYVVQYDLELGQPWKNVDKWMKVSTAFFHADKIKTPTLFLGGALDANVPVLGGEQMYQALKSLGIETELIVYPGEYHGIRRPSFQRDRFERYVAWYSKYLTTAQ